MSAGNIYVDKKIPGQIAYIRRFFCVSKSVTSIDNHQSDLLLQTWLILEVILRFKMIVNVRSPCDSSYSAIFGTLNIICINALKMGLANESTFSAGRGLNTVCGEADADLTFVPSFVSDF